MPTNFIIKHHHLIHNIHSTRVMMIAKIRNEMLGATKRFYRYDILNIFSHQINGQ